MLQTNLKVDKTARYFVLGQNAKPIKKVWLVLHGYGQLANYFLKQFEPLDDGNTLIVAPEGLHRFYWKGFSDTVAASWMTKEDREIDIKDYISLLNKVWGNINNIYDFSNSEITLFAYSQGVATLTRWLLQHDIPAKQIILWAGTLAHDVDFNLLKEKLKHSKAVQLFGKQDEFYNTKQLEKIKQFNIKKSLPLDFKLFDGKHEIIPELLKSFH